MDKNLSMLSKVVRDSIRHEPEVDGNTDIDAYSFYTTDGLRVEFLTHPWHVDTPRKLSGKVRRVQQIYERVRQRYLYLEKQGKEPLLYLHSYGPKPNYHLSHK